MSDKETNNDDDDSLRGAWIGVAVLGGCAAVSLVGLYVMYLNYKKQRSKSDLEAEHSTPLRIERRQLHDRKQHENLQEEHEVVKIYSFMERQAMRMARWPKTHICVSLVLCLIVSVVGFVCGDFDVTADNAGWQSRGTIIADQQTQLMLVLMNQEELFDDNETAWEDLINNVQPGWEEEGDETANPDRRLVEIRQIERLSEEMRKTTFQETVDEPSQDSQLVSSTLPSTHQEMLSFLTRRLRQEKRNKNNHQSGIRLTGCDIDWYSDGRMFNQSRLAPVWKTKEPTDSFLHADVLQELCLSEENTQHFLEENELCFGCDEGCLPPFSIILFARLTILGGMSMDCADLADAWFPLYGLETHRDWKFCATELKESGSAENLPESCGEFFFPTMLDNNFDTSGLVQYTSSIFATYDELVDELYDNVEHFDKGGDLVEGAYDTMFENFADNLASESVTNDMLLATMSAVITGGAMLVHTRSPFLTLAGLIQIILSLPTAYFVYTIIGQLEFFPFLNFIGVFVVFALGADHAFVAVDKWKNGRIEFPNGTCEDVAAKALPDAAGAMLLTTSTTAAAFFGSAICAVAPIRLFAIFCGLLISLDYVINILLVFPCLCIYDNNRKKKNCFMDCHCCQGGIRQDASENADYDERPSFIHRILYKYYQGLHYCRWPLFVVLIVVLPVCSYYASTLQLPNTQEVRMLSPDVEFELAASWRSNLLSTTLDQQGGHTAHIVWGVKPADTGDQNNPNSWSQLVLDDCFNPTSKTAQIYLRDFCSSLFAEDFANPISDDYECSINRFDRWLKLQSNATNPDVTYLLHCDGANGLPVKWNVFDPCLTAWANEEGESSILSRNGMVMIIYLPFKSRVRFENPRSVVDDEWHLITEWMENQSETAPSGVSGAFFSSEHFWFYDTVTQTTKSAVGSGAIALAASAVVIFISSRSFVVTVFSVVSVAYVLTSVTSLMVAIGWTLGFLESICFAILIGVSVDFVIHFSHAYASKRGDVSRGERTKYALIHMGPSILAAAFTTMAGAVIMLFTIITFFQKFALVLFLTIIQATIGSFVVFLTLADCLGPSNPTYLMDQVTDTLSSISSNIQG